MVTKKKKLGDWGEQLAGDFLQQRGYQIIKKNVKLKSGELDIVCQKDSELVFVEVRTRTSLSFGSAEESITEKKSLTLAKLIQEYLEKNKIQRIDFRADLITILVNKNNRKAVIRHWKNVIEEMDEEALDDLELSV